ncbi:MAG TPA: cation diffusion facilitator family transporter [Geothermobacteraceae bacterium]|nr:cation diffusion facilitator family transporter [Geothermobacteraceae bacterium]
MSAHGSNPTKAIMYAFFANLGVAVTKAVAAWFTGSSALAAEAFHSAADVANQVLLLVGLKRSQQPADSEHPLGYGKASYFWSFMVAILLFSSGGLFSIYEGAHKLKHPEPMSYAWVALLVLAVSIVLEGLSLRGCLVEIRKVQQGRTLREWVRTTRSSELLVVLGEDLAALVGLSIALVFVLLAVVTGDPCFDAIGSICIGVLLVVVAIFISIKVKTLLIGRSADPTTVAQIRAMIEADADVLELYNAVTLQMGAQALLAIKIRMRESLSVGEAARAINRLERDIKNAIPDIGWCFVEIDVTD